MRVIQLKEQLLENTTLSNNDASALLPYIKDGEGAAFHVTRGKETQELCLRLAREGDDIKATGSYFIGVDWVKEHELAIQVSPKLNEHIEIDYVRMLNEALCESANYNHLDDLVTIKFDKPSIRIHQKQDLLSYFLIIEYINILERIVRKGLRKSYYSVEYNLKNKVKGKILVGQNIKKNIVRGRIISNFCQFQVCDIDSDENRILKKALTFCEKKLWSVRNAIDTSFLERKVRFIKPFFSNVGEITSIKAITSFKSNPVYKEHYQAVEIAQQILRRYGYDISIEGGYEIMTPPFWIDMSKLFELYVYRKLRNVFTERDEVQYHVHAHYQELDYIINPAEWKEPYIADAKYKPRYNSSGITKEDARQVAGYSRLASIYKMLKLDENKVPPIKCLIIYPDQEGKADFDFTREKEPSLPKVAGYIRMYKVGIRLPEIKRV